MIEEFKIEKADPKKLDKIWKLSGLVLLLFALIFSWYGVKKERELSRWIEVKGRLLERKYQKGVNNQALDSIKGHLVEHPEMFLSVASLFPEEADIVANVTKGSESLFSKAARLICLKDYKEALRLSSELDQQQVTPIIKGANLLRMIALAEEIQDERLPTFILQLEEWKKAHPGEMEKLFSCYQVGEISLEQYLKSLTI